MKEVLMIIAEDNFQDIEFSETRKAILNNGFNVKIASKSKGIKKGVLGLEINAELSFDEIDENKFDAIVFIGGPGAARYIKDEKAWKLARKFFEANKIVAAICIAPLILAYSGILKGKKATVWDDGKQTQIKELQSKKALFQNEKVLIDGKIITANGPPAAKKFGENIALLLKS